MEMFHISIKGEPKKIYGFEAFGGNLSYSLLFPDCFKYLVSYLIYPGVSHWIWRCDIQLTEKHTCRNSYSRKNHISPIQNWHRCFEFFQYCEESQSGAFDILAKTVIQIYLPWCNFLQHLNSLLLCSLAAIFLITLTNSKLYYELWYRS